MPYLKEQQKQRHDAGAPPSSAGELTYALTLALQAYLDTAEPSYRYENLAVCLGALEGAKADLIRRVITPYEELAQATNGDVWPQHLLMTQGDERTIGKPQDSPHERPA